MRNFQVHDERLVLHQDFLDTKTANHIFNELLDRLAWSTESIFMFGKKILVPRLVCWYGNDDAVYKYSGVEHVPLPWIEPLIDLKSQLENFTQHKFNSVLCNLYRDEKDSMGWHADNEKELGDHPFIASLSLGEERIFKARHKTTREQFKLPLTHGSLLIMSGDFQQYWQHCVPKSSTPKSKRINLTFRYIMSTKSS